MRTIDEMSRNSEAETACETEKSFFSNFFGSLQGLVTIILIVTSLVVVCIVFIAANTASMAVRERAGEIAVLKAIGFGRARHLRHAARRDGGAVDSSPAPPASASRHWPHPAAARRRRLERHPRPARQLHHHAAGDRAGPPPLALGRHVLPVSSRPAARRASPWSRRSTRCSDEANRDNGMRKKTIRGWSQPGCSPERIHPQMAADGRRWTSPRNRANTRIAAPPPETVRPEPVEG